MLKLRIRILAPVVAALLILQACAGAINPRGKWQRQLVDGNIGASGVEVLEIKPDSTFHILNSMIFEHNDSDFTCSYRFETTISGQWQLDGHNMLLLPDTTSYAFDDGDFKANAVRNPSAAFDSISQTMHADLAANIAAYYRAVYNNVASAGGIPMHCITIANSQMAANINATTITWNKI